MKAIVLKEPGAIENLILKNISSPAVSDNEVLVEVKAISINPVDTVVRKDARALHNFLKIQDDSQPIILGWDISGNIIGVGKFVTTFKKGDEVFGMVKFPGHGKAYAEYVAAPENQLALKPSNISHEEAAPATLAALTAWQSLVVHAKLKKGDKVLIHGAAGGVGHYAVQIAKEFGTYTIGTASLENRDFVLGLGADQFIDYNNELFEDLVKNADVVLDPYGLIPKHLERSLDTMKHGGRLISLTGSFDESFNEKAKARKIFIHRHIVHSNGEDMQQIASLLAKTTLKTFISQSYTFEEIPQAHLKIETGKTKGKVVVNL